MGSCCLKTSQIGQYAYNDENLTAMEEARIVKKNAIKTEKVKIYSDSSDIVSTQYVEADEIFDSDNHGQANLLKSNFQDRNSDNYVETEPLETDNNLMNMVFNEDGPSSPIQYRDTVQTDMTEEVDAQNIIQQQQYTSRDMSLITNQALRSSKKIAVDRVDDNQNTSVRRQSSIRQQPLSAKNERKSTVLLQVEMYSENKDGASEVNSNNDQFYSIAEAPYNEQLPQQVTETQFEQNEKQELNQEKPITYLEAQQTNKPEVVLEKQHTRIMSKTELNFLSAIEGTEGFDTCFSQDDEEKPINMDTDLKNELD